MRPLSPLIALSLLACTSGTAEVKADIDTGGMDTGDVEDTDPPDPRFDPLREVIASDLALSDAPGVSVAIYQDGAVIFAEGFGSAHPEEDIPVTPETLFQIGSTTKMLTSIAMLQDVEAGAISMEDTLAEVYPASEFALNADWNDQIQMHHLLTHQGGFYEYYDATSSSSDAQLATWHEDVYFENIWLMSPPGAFWNYSNLNYSIAGMIVESLDSEPYADLMDSRIFSPLGMDRTYMRIEAAKADGDYALGVGYMTDSAGFSSYGPVLIDDVTDAATMRPAGGGTWSTPSQMLLVADFLLNGASEVLGSELHGELTASQVPMRDILDAWAYGYGVMVGQGLYLGEDWQETEVWIHGGNTASYTSDFYVLPEHNFAISILSSGYGTDFSGSVGAAISTLVDLGSPEVGPEISFDLMRLDDHVGTYEDVYNVGEITITRADSSLYIDMPYIEALGYSVSSELYPNSDTLFYVEIDEAWYELKFIGEPGTPTEYVANRFFVGTRTEAPDDPVDPIEPEDTGSPEEEEDTGFFED